jgi:CDP-paratose 2-epimerase
LKDGWSVVGIDNDRRGYFFGTAGSTASTLMTLLQNKQYQHVSIDIRSPDISTLLLTGFDLIVHCAAQPSHDWAVKDLIEDFGVNALGTMYLLKAYKEACTTNNWRVPFIHVSTSKVYGDNPNTLVAYQELETRYEPWGQDNNIYWQGIPEQFSVDRCLHSFFGVSKLSGDLLAQEFGRYFNLPVGIFRPGCITGSAHKGVELHGFLQYLATCIATGKEYRIYGYKGKQVRCNIHADDLVNAFMLYADNPQPAAVYNMGGRGLDCSLLEAVAAFERLIDRKANTVYVDTPRIGDHQWWISDSRKARRELGWAPKRLLPSILEELADSARVSANRARLL